MINSISDSAGGAIDLKRTRRVKPTHYKLDRLPPHSPEAEQAVLGCCLLSPNDCVPDCVAKFSAGGAEFYDLRHQEIFKRMVEMSEHAEPIDLITLQNRLQEKQILEQVGGLAYLATLPDAVPSAANLEYYLDIVREKFVLRSLVHTCTDIVGKIYDYDGDVETFLDEAEKEFLKLNPWNESPGAVTSKTLVDISITAMETMFNGGSKTGGLTTGFSDFDKMTDGLHEGEMIVIAARPSMGKTSLAMNIAEHVAVNGDVPVCVFSLEMTGEALMTRMICSRARVNIRNIKDGFLKTGEFEKLTLASVKLANAHLFIDDTAGLSILQLRARARRLWQQHSIKLFVIDYIQLLHSNTPRATENRVQEISEISSGLKALAKELKVPIIVLSQLNRELEKTQRKPRLSDLRESGAIEQDADVVGLLYKPDNKDPENEAQTDAIPVNLLIAKQRNGPTGDVNLTFLKPYTRFESAAKVTEDDLPYKD